MSNPFLNNNYPEPGSKEFHEIRSKGIGGSEISVIMGISPYRTRYSLWLEKTGISKPEDISHLPHVQRGIQAEPIARKKLEDSSGTKYTPRVWEQVGICRCSDDGSNLDHKEMLEIKTMGIEAHQQAHLGFLPEYYRLQCIWNLGVSGLERCHFVSCRPEDDYDLATVCIKADPNEFSLLKKAAEDFWHLVESKTPPEMTDKDTVELTDMMFKHAALDYAQAKRRLKETEDYFAEKEAILLSHLGNKGSVKGFGVKVSRFSQKGTVDYSKVEALKGLDLEPYRKPASIRTRITIQDAD